MESISTINGLSSLLLIMINAGGIFRILFCIVIKISGEMQEQQQMSKRIKHTIIFLAVANSLMTINMVAQHYWG